MDNDTNVQPVPNDDTISLCGNKAILREETKPERVIKDNSRIGRFIREYINNGHNGSEAVRKAGYIAKQPHNTANYLLKRPYIANEIQRREDELKRNASVDKPTFILDLQKFMVKCEEAGRLREVLECKKLLASCLGHTQPDQAQQINIFGNLDALEAKILGKKQVIDVPQSSVVSKDT